MDNKQDLFGKRILLLGGHTLMCHVIKQAKAMGIYTIVTDNVKGSPAKRIADEAYDISTVDIDKITQLAHDCHADGVMTGYADINLKPCCIVCKRLGMPFYATLEQIDIAHNKRKFKELCSNHDIRVVENIPLDLCKNSPEKIDYPVIIKPTDNYGSKGISVCNTKDELPAAIDKAFAFSTCKDIIIEPFIVADDINLYFTVQNGILSLSAMADRLLNHEQHGFAPQPVGYFFPSKYIDLYFEKVHDKLQNMISDLGIKEGTFFVQGFATEGDLVFFEMGLRLSGSAGYLLIRHLNEIDQITMHLRYALTSKFDGWNVQEFDNPRFSKPACIIIVLLKNGTIARIDGLDEIMSHPNIFDMFHFLEVNDTNKSAGTLNQVYGRFYLCADTADELRNTIKFFKNTLRITDTDGNNMILNSFDEDKILV